MKPGRPCAQSASRHNIHCSLDQEKHVRRQSIAGECKAFATILEFTDNLEKFAQHGSTKCQVLVLICSCQEDAKG